MFEDLSSKEIRKQARNHKQAAEEHIRQYRLLMGEIGRRDAIMMDLQAQKAQKDWQARVDRGETETIILHCESCGNSSPHQIPLAKGSERKLYYDCWYGNLGLICPLCHHGPVAVIIQEQS